MSRIAKLILSFFRFADAALQVKAAKIIQMMTDNPYFIYPLEPLDAADTALKDYTGALTDAEGDKLKTAIKNTARRRLEKDLAQLGRYVSYIANGNVDILVSSGFDLAKDPEPATLGEPGLVKVVNGNTTGRLKVSLPKVKGAYSYLHQITPDPLLPNSIWEGKPTNGTKCVFDGLIAGHKYWIRVAAVGSFEQVAYTNIVSQIVL